MTKRAQFPIIRWLPAAIAAPTPVSALVHSSTLVTAGVFLITIFSSIRRFFLLKLISCISIITITIARISAFMEKDFKKIVAFSTLSQIGILFLILSNLKINLILFHLFSHAFFKRILFISVGSHLHASNSEQDTRKNLKNFDSNLKSKLLIIIRIINLIGIFFLRGFFSKDYFLILLKKKFFINILFFLIIFLTFIYSSKILFYLTNPTKKIKKENRKILNFSILPLFLLSIF
jgi:NADH-ubiquinone oxidoreductase chain 5